MATIRDHLDSIIQQADYLRTLLDEDKISGEVDVYVADYVRQADEMIDDACTTVNDDNAERWNNE